jgi:outer membrane lipoprotein-sorting protein
MMKKTILFLILILSFINNSFSQDLSAEKMMEEADRVLYPENFYMTLTISTTKPGKRTRIMKIESYYKQGIGSLMEITEPARSKGTRFLQQENSLWIYNPKSRSKKAVRLSAKDSFQGSLFSNNDMSDPNYGDDYFTSIKGKEIIEHPDFNKVNCVILEGIGKDEYTPYSRIRMWVTEKGNIPLKIEYYAKSGFLFKQMLLFEIKQIAGRRRPTKIQMKSMEQKEAMSEVIIEQLEIRNNLSDSLFTQQSLTRR